MSKKKSKGLFSGLFSKERSRETKQSAQIESMAVDRFAARHDMDDFDDQILRYQVDQQLDDDIRYDANSGGALSNNSDEIVEREQLSFFLKDSLQKVCMEESKQLPQDQIQNSDISAESAKKDAMAEEKIVSRAAEPLQKEKIEQTLAQILAISAQSPVQPFPTGKPTFQDVIKRQHNTGFWCGN